MLRTTFIFIWRFLVLCLIGLLAYLTTFFVFPFIGNRTPAFFGLLIFYGVLAYLIIPLGSRLLRLILKPNHVPTHVSTGDGWPSDPINIALTVRNKRHLARAMRAAGWTQADDDTFRNSFREFLALIFNTSYPSAPCSKLYMFGRSQDITFEIPVGNSPRTRHHVRFWRVEPRADMGTNQHRFWWHTLRDMVGMDRELWAGAATFDKHFLGMRWRNLQITHQIDSDTNKERDFTIGTLDLKGFIRSSSSLQAGEPYSFRGQNIGVNIISDGSVVLCELRRVALPLLRTK